MECGKHDCFIVSSEGEVLAGVFTIPNNMDGFHCLLQKIRECTNTQDKIKVGLEATGHYSYNLLGFLLDNGLATYVLNPLRTNLYRKSLSLRKAKTDRVDARTIALMLLSDAGLKPYTSTAYHNEELKSLTRYRFDKVKERAKLKTSVSRLVCILFPELEKLVPSLHLASVYALLEEFPGAKQVASAHLTRLKSLLETASKGHYKRDMALEIRDAARNSIGSRMPAKSLELQHTIRLIRELDAEIEEIEEQIQSIMAELYSPITTIPGMGFRMAAMILAEVGDFTRFDSPDKLLAYAGMSPSTEKPCAFLPPRRFFPCAYAISSLYRTGAPCEESGAPHAPQKRLPGGISAPHWGHLFSSFAPQLLQNLAPAAHWVLQAGQTTIPAFSSAPAFRTTTERPPETMHCSITWKISSGSFFCL